jgi:hypothetical protein
LSDSIIALRSSKYAIASTILESKVSFDLTAFVGFDGDDLIELMIDLICFVK